MSKLRREVEADPARAAPDPDPGPQERAHAHGGLAALSVAALGVVYGDIGTSPIYAIRECFHGAHGGPVSPANVLGVLSLIFWSLALVVSFKYLAYVLRADHGGEGGILALTALATPGRAQSISKRTRALLLLGLFGAGLLCGESIITPAISVMSAAEGLKVISPSLEHLVLPATVVILALLFSVQHRGTRGVGAVFGPITALWFVALAAIGLSQIAQTPAVLEALNPAWAVRFFVDNGFSGFVILGAVVLAVTGVEAIYLDLGHFGRKPIRFTWFALVLPALLCNYFGQGALLLREPGALADLFFHAVPRWALVPMVVLTTCATVIASQAVISGAFSLARQAVMMGYLPRMRVEHTSAREIGQIYVPAVNWGLMLATIALALAFGSSSALAAAYGIAVTSTMVITSILAGRVARMRWRWPLALVVAVTGFFLVIDLAFLGANLFKIAHGGWVPLAIAGGILLLMTTWKRGRALLARRTAERTVSLSSFMGRVRDEADPLPVTRVSGTAVYMCSAPDVAPLALMHAVEHYHVLHERVVFLTIRVDDAPHVPLAERAFVEPLGKGFWRVTGVYGYMQSPDVPTLLAYVAELHPELTVTVDETTFFLGQETILASDRPGMARWRESLFAVMARNSQKATRFFGLPTSRVVEVGAYIEI